MKPSAKTPLKTLFKQKSLNAPIQSLALNREAFAEKRPSAKGMEFNRMLLDFQKGELNAHFIYAGIAGVVSGENKRILEKISRLELKHYGFWKKQTGVECSRDSFMVFYHSLLAKLFGLTFALKLLERMESKTGEKYAGVVRAFPKISRLVGKGERQELELLRRLSEQKIEYVGSIMLGIEDAVVEFTGTLSGLAFALQNTKLIGIAGLIGGIAASASMASSEYLSKRSESIVGKNPKIAAFYTGIAYFLVVLLLVLPNFVFENPYTALASTVINAFFVIVFFTYFVSVTKELPFKKRLAETLLISFGIAAISFTIGMLLRTFLNISA